MKRNRIQTIRKSRRSRIGAAVVEFAFIAPLMILLTMGMLEIGRMVMVKQLLINASREGARLAVLPTTSTLEVETQVREELESASIIGASIAVSPQELAGAEAGTPVTVAISIPATEVSWIPKPLFSVYTTLQASTTMRRESQ